MPPKKQPKKKAVRGSKPKPAGFRKRVTRREPRRAVTPITFTSMDIAIFTAMADELDEVVSNPHQRLRTKEVSQTFHFHPESDELGPKRTRSGRLSIKPLKEWGNEKVIYEDFTAPGLAKIHRVVRAAYIPPLFSPAPRTRKVRVQCRSQAISGRADMEEDVGSQVKVEDDNDGQVKVEDNASVASSGDVKREYDGANSSATI